MSDWADKRAAEFFDDYIGPFGSEIRDALADELRRAWDEALEAAAKIVSGETKFEHSYWETVADEIEDKVAAVLALRKGAAGK